jgi:hypothetical protein
VDGDRPRLIARRSELGYVERAALALPHEPEAVDAATQAGLTLAAHRRQVRERADAWQTGRRLILDGVRVVRAARPPRAIVGDLRVLERQVSRIDDRLRRTS